MRKSFLGFTLSEVLITLAVIGVVAAMTLPTLIQKQQEKESVVKLKKIYSILSQAYTSAASVHGDSSEWALGEIYSPEGAKAIADIMKPYFKLSKDCGTESGGDCFPDLFYKRFNDDGTEWYKINDADRVYKVALADGTLLAFEGGGDNYCKRADGYCAKVFVDINGKQKPNQAGYDLFSFYFVKGKVLPSGAQTATILMGGAFNPANIMNPNVIGDRSTAWVLVNENMDYKRCPEKIGWDKASSCKD